MKVGTLNIGTMTGRERELADMMERRNVDILCLQEEVRNEDEGGQAEVVWTCHEERPRVCRKKDDENGVTRKEEKKETKKKIFRCCKRRYGGSWCEADGH